MSRPAAIRKAFETYVLPTYGRFDLVLDRGKGSYVWDVDGQKYLDMGTGIAVASLGHAHPLLVEALHRQASSLIHVSNLYHYEIQARLAERITDHIAPGKCFFCNSGAEANETLYKLARRFGHEEGRFEILSCHHSFHGRTLAGIAATGQEKVKIGFGPALPGFRQVPFNDLDALQRGLSPATVAVLIEGIQGEGGIIPAEPEFLLGLRRLCDDHRLLLLYDGVQCGQFRTGRFQSYQRLLETADGGASFLPDAVSMAKSLGAGFPIGAVWVREDYTGVLGPGTHGSTFGGTPLACAAALQFFDTVESEGLAENARQLGAYLTDSLNQLKQQFPTLIQSVRGMGLMLGIEFRQSIARLPDAGQATSIQLVTLLNRNHLLAIPAGQNVVRFLPPLNLTRPEADEAIEITARTLRTLVP